MIRVVVVLCLLASSASAERWYRGEHGSNRVLHLSLTTVGLIAYPLLDGVEEDWAADTCRWCDPPAFDRAVRESFRWNDTERAKLLSDVFTFGATPVVSFGLLSLGTFSGDRSWARTIDDFTPVLEAMVVTQWVTRIVKLGVGRQRPHVRFTGAQDDEGNLSFFSGHTSRAFSIATAAGMIARQRGYKSELYIWAAGLTLATASGAFRVAADRHYMTDVLTGAAVGIVAGLTVPLLMKRCYSCPSSVEVTSSPGGLAFGGAW